MGEARALGHVYRRLVGARMRSDLQYRLSLAMYTAGQLLAVALDFAAIAVIFHRVPVLAGWSAVEVAFLFGTASTAFGLADVFASPVERCAGYIRAGTFDQLLTRPLGPLLQLVCREFELRRFGRVATGLVVLVVTVSGLPVAHTPARLAVIVGIVGCGAVIFGSLFVITSAIAFWTVETQEVAASVTYGGWLLAEYPIDVFGSWLRRVVLVVPIAFVSAIPAAWVLGRTDSYGFPTWLRLASPAVALACVLVARAVWAAAIRHYQSTGS